MNYVYVHVSCMCVCGRGGRGREGEEREREPGDIHTYKTHPSGPLLQKLSNEFYVNYT